MVNKQELFEYTVELLRKKSIRHESHHFHSGAIMLDIWKDGRFYVVQFENEHIGFSKIDEDTGFDTIPDEKFYDNEKFKARLMQTLDLNLDQL